MGTDELSSWPSLCSKSQDQRFLPTLYCKAEIQLDGDQVARMALSKFSTIEDTGDLKPCHNSARKFGYRLCHLTP